MTTVVLVRHGLTHLTGPVLAGWTPDLHLDERGAAQAAAVAERLRPLAFDAVVSSPLDRCLDTATAVLEGRDQELQVDERLGECRYGDWTGRPLKELAKDPLWKVVQQHPSAAIFPGGGGESLRRMQLRAVDAVRSLPDVDPAGIVVTGVSQGGGMTLAVAGLVDGLAAVVPDVPFLCDIARACTITDAFPYQELRLWLRMHREDSAAALRTVSFADALHFAPRATAPALFSVGLMDECCPPSTVFGVYNRYAGPKDIDVWEYADHEGGGPDQLLRQLAFLRRLGVLED